MQHIFFVGNISWNEQYTFIMFFSFIQLLYPTCDLSIESWIWEKVSWYYRKMDNSC